MPAQRRLLPRGADPSCATVRRTTRRRTPGTDRRGARAGRATGTAWSRRAARSCCGTRAAGGSRLVRLRPGGRPVVRRPRRPAATAATSPSALGSGVFGIVGRRVVSTTSAAGCGPALPRRPAPPAAGAAPGDGDGRRAGAHRVRRDPAGRRHGAVGGPGRRLRRHAVAPAARDRSAGQRRGPGPAAGWSTPIRSRRRRRGQRLPARLPRGRHPRPVLGALVTACPQTLDERGDGWGVNAVGGALGRDVRPGLRHPDRPGHGRCPRPSMPRTRASTAVWADDVLVAFGGVDAAGGYTGDA